MELEVPIKDLNVVQLNDVEKSIGIIIDKRVYCSRQRIETDLSHIDKMWNSDLLFEALKLYKNFHETIYNKNGFDWSVVPVDTKIVVRELNFFNNVKEVKCYFAKFENDRVFYFANQQTSFTTNKMKSVPKSQAVLFKERN